MRGSVRQAALRVQTACGPSPRAGLGPGAWPGPATKGARVGLLPSPSTKCPSKQAPGLLGHLVLEEREIAWALGGRVWDCWGTWCWGWADGRVAKLGWVGWGGSAAAGSRGGAQAWVV
jgi:hypothetical protein